MSGELQPRAAEGTRELTRLNAQLLEEITAREAAEAQVRQMQKQVRQMQRMAVVGQITGGIAHDFANMLTIMMGSLEIICHRLAQRKTNIAGPLENALSSGKRATMPTHRLLDFSRQHPIASEVVDVNALVYGMAALLRCTLGQNIELECACAGGLWRTCVDPGQLENAILNLAVNARDAMPDSGRLTIETQNACLDGAYVAANPEFSAGQYVVVTVTDTGTGMPPDVVARAFDPFFTTKPEGRGTGLGLSQVHAFVRQSQGFIKLHSELGRGTSLKIYLPRCTDSGIGQRTYAASA